MSTGSPGLIDHAIRIALKHLDDEKPRSRHGSSYAIPVITHGLRTPMSSSTGPSGSVRPTGHRTQAGQSVRRPSAPRPIRTIASQSDLSV